MTDTIKKTKPVKTAPVKKVKNRAAAFMNWKLKRNDGTYYRADSGFPIFQNPEFPKPSEDLLIDLAKQNGGTVRLMMEVQIVINDDTPKATISLADFTVI